MSYAFSAQMDLLNNHSILANINEERSLFGVKAKSSPSAMLFICLDSEFLVSLGAALC